MNTLQMTLFCPWCLDRERRLTAGKPITATLMELCMKDPDLCITCWNFVAQTLQEQREDDNG